MTYTQKRFQTPSEMISFANRAKEDNMFLISVNNPVNVFGVGGEIEATFVTIYKNDRDLQRIWELMKQ